MDLGVFAGPVLIFGGPYGNLEATDALIAAADRLGISARSAICTGDVVAYGADPQAVCGKVRAWGSFVVMGNCEESFASDSDDCGCGFTEGSACEVLSAQWFGATRRDLDRETKEWMGTLPRLATFTLGGHRLAVVHGGLEKINQFIFASTSADEKRRQVDAAGCDAIIAGHCGLPFSQVIDGRLWHNSGALGMPANDGTPRVWFSVLSQDRTGIEVTHHALDYDHRAAAAKMRERGYPAGYADCLVTGLWPSCDILPEVERADRGRPLAPKSLTWVKRPLRVA